MSDSHTPAPLRIGAVISQTFQVLGRNFLTFFVLAVLFSGVPTAIIGYIQAQTVSEAFRSGSISLNPWTYVGAFLSYMLILILQGSLIRGAVSQLNGQKASLSDMLQTGLRNFLPLLGLGLLAGLAFACGFILLIVPGVMLALAWCVIAPAYVAEPLKFFDAFGRSAQLTRGNRWRILLLFVVIFAIFLLISMTLGAIFGVSMMATVGSSSAIFVQSVVISPIVNTFNALIGAVGSAVLYIELRRAREGVGVDALASVFD
jgi:hypothetical protein